MPYGVSVESDSRHAWRRGPVGPARDLLAAASIAGLAWMGGALALDIAFGLSDVQAIAGSAALILLVGGMSMLTLIVVLVLLQNLMPVRTVASEGSGARFYQELRPLAVPGGSPLSLRPTGAGKGAPKTGPRPPADHALDQAIQLGLGEPRILRHRSHYTQLRLYHCRSCSPVHPRSGAKPVDGCAFEEESLRNAFASFYRDPVVVRESACRLRGHAECEFEVRH